MMGVRMSVGRRARVAAVVTVVALVAAACQPGWTNPFVGTGDGSGTAPGATTPLDDASVALSQPTATVPIPGEGFYVLDVNECAIYRVMNDTSTLYAGTPGTCGYSGDSGPATEAKIQTTNDTASQNALALGPDGTLYFAGANAIRAIAPDGTITSMAPPGAVISLTVAPDGTLFAATVNPGIYRLESAGSWAAVYTSDDAGYAGLVALSPTQLVFQAVSNDPSGSGQLVELDTTTNSVTSLGVTTGGFGAISVAAADGVVYAGATSAGSLPTTITANGVTRTDQVLRIDPDGTVTPIAGTGTPDPATGRQRGIGLTLDLSPMGLAATPNHGLLISSGHVVYRLALPAEAGGTASTTSSTTTTTVPPAS